MATVQELLKSENRFMFRGKKYRLSASIPEPVIVMVNEDGETFYFGINGFIKDEFVLIPDDKGGSVGN